MFAVILAQFIGDFGLGLGGCGPLHRGTHDESETLLFQHALKGLLYLWVHAGRDGVKEFDDCYLGPQPRIDTAQLQSDHARADHDQLLGHLAQFQRPG